MTTANPYAGTDNESAWAQGYQYGQQNPSDSNPTAPAPWDGDSITIWQEGALAGQQDAQANQPAPDQTQSTPPGQQDTQADPLDAGAPEQASGSAQAGTTPAIDSLTFWLNAFIPNSVCDQFGNVFAITVPTPSGFPVPSFRHFAGDQREFSNDINGSARMHSEVTIAGMSAGNAQIAHQDNHCGQSQEIDDNGTVIAAATADSSRMFFSNLRGSQTTDPQGGVVDGIPGSVQVDFEGSAALPLAGFTPDIDYSGTLTIDLAEGNVLAQGAISGFPGFEMYYSVNGGPPVTLGQFEPISPIELIGPENRPFKLESRIVG